MSPNKNAFDEQAIKAVCPCCGKERGVADLLEQERVLDAAQLRPWGSVQGWTAAAALKNTLQWACRPCFKTRRATAANPLRQTFCDHPPYLAYFDQERRCEDCGRRFHFTSTEQRYWYEQLKFWVQSRPKQCAPCRRSRRQRLQAQASLQSTLAGLDEKDPEQLARAAVAYLEAGSPKKASEFLRRAKNLASDDEIRQQLLRRIEALETQAARKQTQRK